MIPSKHDVTNNESFGAVSVSMHINNWRGLYNEYNQLKSLMSVQLDIQEQLKELHGIADAKKHQKELSDAREKLLMDTIGELKKSLDVILIASQKSEESHALNIYYTAHDTLSSVAKKLEGL